MTTVREYLFIGFPGCSNHDCIVTGKKTGMGTNGQCHCLQNMSRSELMRLQARLQVIADKEIK